MTQQLSGSTKVKLIMPLLYATISVLYFVLALPEKPELYHLLGIGITLVSFAFWITARVQLGNAFSIAPKSKFIVKNGLYRKLRHPVYYFSISAVTGLVIFTWQTALLTPLIALLVIEAVRIRKEEALLTTSFGSEYQTYKEKTWF